MHVVLKKSLLHVYTCILSWTSSSHVAHEFHGIVHGRYHSRVIYHLGGL